MEKRFTTNKYYIYDHFKDDRWLVNEVEAEEIVEIMNNLDMKARERSKVLSKLQKENEQLKHDATVLIQSNQDYRKENEQLKQFQNKVAEVIESKMGDNVCNDYKMEVLKEVWNELELDRVWFE